MKRLAVRLATLPLLGAAVLTSFPAFAHDMDTAGATNNQITLNSSSEFLTSLEISRGGRCGGGARNCRRRFTA